MKTTKTNFATARKPIAMKSKAVVCTFYWKLGARCVLAPEVREFEKCGAAPCTIQDVKSVTISRLEEKPRIDISRWIPKK